MRGQILRVLAVCGAACVTVIGCAPAAPLPEEKPPALSQHAPPTSSQYFVYHVRRGDTLYSIGERFGVRWEEIAKTNHIRDVTDLDVGRLLYIRKVPGVRPPEPQSPAPPPDEAAPRRRVSRSDLHRGHPSARFWWPTVGRVVRHYNESVRGLPEPGVGIAAPLGTEVCAVADGQVVACLSGQDAPVPVWGNVVAVAHSDGMVSWYGQLDQILVAKGRRVNQGQPIGTVGSSGAAGGRELAFRMFRDERFVDPERYLP